MVVGSWVFFLGSSGMADGNAAAPLCAHDDGASADGLTSASTPTTTSPATSPFLSLADQAFTPLSLLDESFGSFSDGVPSTKGASDVAAAAQTQLHATRGAWPTTNSANVQAATPTAAPLPSTHATPAALADEKPSSGDTTAFATALSHSNSLAVITSARQRQASDSPTRNAHAPSAARDQQLYEPPQFTTARHRTVHALPITAHSAPDTDASTNLSASPTESPPLRIGSVQPDTHFAHPKPLARTTSISSNLPIKHPVPDLNTRSGAYTGNVAQLEATAEKLSMTSSIDNAIRDLHGELKRSDSKRSSILAASVRAASIDENLGLELPSLPQLKRHLSNASSIVGTNIAARYGGYSPAGYVMSPSPSLTGRLRSGSKNSSGRPDFDIEPSLSRHGPGKASNRSVQSNKMSLQEISESEPIALTQDAMDAADNAPPIEDDVPADLEATPRVEDAYAADAAVRGALGHVLEAGFGDMSTLDLSVGAQQHPQTESAERDGSIYSQNTADQEQDAFVDFDGVHWEPPGPVLNATAETEPQAPMPRPVLKGMKTRPQSYMDPMTGQQMLYYPARVPAMLNLPPKLSAKPRAADRNERQSRVLSAMEASNRQSALLGSSSNAHRESWLPDPVSGHRNSFAASTTLDHLKQSEMHLLGEEEEEEQPPQAPEGRGELVPDELRRPQRLSQNHLSTNRMSGMPELDHIPSHLRASAFFDLPSTKQPEVQTKNGSAMNALDSILDAAARAPVGAFTDHAFAGKLGAEVYGRRKKRKTQSQPALVEPPVAAEPELKKRTSFMWLGKRSSSYSGEDKNKAKKATAALDTVDSEDDEGESQALTSSIHGGHAGGDGEDSEYEVGEEEEGSESEEEYSGPPTTLLAELQLRKQQHKKRTAMRSQAFAQGMGTHVTLLEMDAVAEAQMRNKKGKRVNLAWQEPAEQLDGESDDEDVPLAVLAAKHHGAKNMADIEQPIGLMEQRALEENEPLSRRRARLQGNESVPLALTARHSMLSLSATRIFDTASSASRQATSPDPPEEEVETESLGERKRRLEAKQEAKEEAEGRLPRTRPVSSSFSAELLSQFGDLEQPKDKAEDDRKESTTPNVLGEEETLGQRRRRLQAEREAREREMSYGNLTGAFPAGANIRRVSMADGLATHPKRENPRTIAERVRVERERRMALERDAKLTTFRGQMPQTLTGPSLERAGGFLGGVYNDGVAGASSHVPQAAPAPSVHGMATGPYNGAYQDNRASVAYSNMGLPMQQPPYGATNGYGGMPTVYSPYGMNAVNPYGNGAPAMYSMGGMAPPMQMQVPTPGAGSLDRVERWRQSIQP